MNCLEDLKHEFAVMVDCIGTDIEVFNSSRQREVKHAIERMRAHTFVDLENNYIDTTDFDTVFFSVETMLDKIARLSRDYEETKDRNYKEQLVKIHYNLKAMVSQVNDTVQNFELPEGFKIK